MAARVLNEAEISVAARSFLRPQRNWSGMCEAAAWNLTNAFVDGARSFPTATAARRASKIEGSGFGPAGAWVWMSGVIEDGIDYGHVAYHLGGGRLFMASSTVTNIPGFTALGFVGGAYYMNRFSNQRLEGWSWDHGGTIIPPKPQLPQPKQPQEEDDMPSEEWLEKKFQEVRERVEQTRAIAEDARARAENIENKVDLGLRESGIKDEQFPKPAVPRVF